MKTRLLVIILVGIVISSIFATLIYQDHPKTPWDCRMKHGKVKEAIQDCLDGLTEQPLPPCTSDRTACFNQETNLCDPSGWECGNNEGIFEEIIENED